MGVLITDFRKSLHRIITPTTTWISYHFYYWRFPKRYLMKKVRNVQLLSFLGKLNKHITRLRWNKHNAVRGDGGWRHFWSQAVHQRRAGRIISWAVQRRSSAPAPAPHSRIAVYRSLLSPAGSPASISAGHSDKARICQRETFSKLSPAIALNASIRSVMVNNSVAAKKALEWSPVR